MKKQFLLLTIIGIFLISCEKSDTATANTKKVKPQLNKRFENHIDSVSYAIGLDIAMRLEQQFRDIDNDMLTRGIRDHLEGNDLYLTDKERVAVIKKYNDITAPKYKMDLEKSNTIEGGRFFDENAKKDGVIEDRSGIQYKILTPADGPKPQPKDLVQIHYTGRLIDGTVFDSSYDRGEPAVFPVDRVVPGFSVGLQLMSKGAKYEFYIPGHLGYAQNEGPGGPMATMIFQVELLDIVKNPEENPQD